MLGLVRTLVRQCREIMLITRKQISVLFGVEIKNKTSNLFTSDMSRMFGDELVPLVCWSLTGVWFSSLIGGMRGGKVGSLMPAMGLGGIMALSTDLLRLTTLLPSALVLGPTPS